METLAPTVLILFYIGAIILFLATIFTPIFVLLICVRVKKIISILKALETLTRSRR